MSDLSMGHMPLEETRCCAQQNVEVLHIIIFYTSLSRSSTLYHLHSSDRINSRKSRAGIRWRRAKDILPSAWAVRLRNLRVHIRSMLMNEGKKMNVRYDLQVTSLISEQPSNKKKGRSKRAHLLVANVIQATENFIHKAGEIAHENPDMRHDLLQSMEEVKRTGNTIDSASADDQCFSQVTTWRPYRKNSLTIPVPNRSVNKWSSLHEHFSRQWPICLSWLILSMSNSFSNRFVWYVCNLALPVFFLLLFVDWLGRRRLAAYSWCFQSRRIGSLLQAIWERHCWLESTCAATSTGKWDRAVSSETERDVNMLFVRRIWSIELNKRISLLHVERSNEHRWCYWPLPKRIYVTLRFRTHVKTVISSTTSSVMQSEWSLRSRKDDRYPRVRRCIWTHRWVRWEISPEHWTNSMWVRRCRTLAEIWITWNIIFLAPRDDETAEIQRTSDPTTTGGTSGEHYLRCRALGGFPFDARRSSRSNCSRMQCGPTGSARSTGRIHSIRKIRGLVVISDCGDVTPLIFDPFFLSSSRERKVQKRMSMQRFNQCKRRHAICENR